MMTQDLAVDQLIFDPAAELVSLFYYDSSDGGSVGSCEEEDIELYDLYDDHLSQIQSPFSDGGYEDIEAGMRDSVNLTDLEEKLAARLSTATIGAIDFERARASSPSTPEDDPSELSSPEVFEVYDEIHRKEDAEEEA